MLHSIDLLSPHFLTEQTKGRTLKCLRSRAQELERGSNYVHEQALSRIPLFLLLVCMSVSLLPCPAVGSSKLPNPFPFFGRGGGGSPGDIPSPPIIFIHLFPNTKTAWTGRTDAICCSNLCMHRVKGGHGTGTEMEMPQKCSQN